MQSPAQCAAWQCMCSMWSACRAQHSVLPGGACAPCALHAEPSTVCCLAMHVLHVVCMQSPAKCAAWQCMCSIWSACRAQHSVLPGGACAPCALHAEPNTVCRLAVHALRVVMHALHDVASVVCAPVGFDAQATMPATVELPMVVSSSALLSSQTCESRLSEILAPSLAPLALKWLTSVVSHLWPLEHLRGAETPICTFQLSLTSPGGENRLGPPACSSCL